MNLEILQSIDKSKEDVVHDLALLLVKQRMEKGNIKSLGELLETYADQVDTMKALINNDERLKDFFKS